jgi:cytochrome c-type biogenesis protein CcmH/NrfF
VTGRDISSSRHLTRDWLRLAENLRRFARLAVIVAFAAITALDLSPAAAQDTLPPAPYAYRQLDDPALEAKAQGLMETLRCLKCQSQSIADSDAPMAGDMRSQVRQRIAAGEEPEAIRAWLVERYGDYVSYAPRVTQLTWPLFAAPLLLLALAALLLRRRFGKGDA